jgi:hypothetical protein
MAYSRAKLKSNGDKLRIFFKFGIMNEKFNKTLGMHDLEMNQN